MHSMGQTRVRITTCDRVTSTLSPRRRRSRGERPITTLRGWPQPVAWGHLDRRGWDLNSDIPALLSAPRFAQTSILCSAQLWTQNHLEDSHSKACTKPRSRTQERDIIRQTFSIMNVTWPQPAGVQTCSHVSPMCVYLKWQIARSRRDLSRHVVWATTRGFRSLSLSFLPVGKKLITPGWDVPEHLFYDIEKCGGAKKRQSLSSQGRWKREERKWPAEVFFMFDKEGLVLAKG